MFLQVQQFYLNSERHKTQLSLIIHSGTARPPCPSLNAPRCKFQHHVAAHSWLYSGEMAAERSPPSIGRLDLSSAHNPENQAGTLNSGRVPLSARRLSKSVLHADSNSASSNAAGIVMLKDSEGTPRAVRVVQKEESEGRNIIRVGWIWSTEGKTYQIELRHGRKSGIRKIYINKFYGSV